MSLLIFPLRHAKPYQQSISPMSPSRCICHMAGGDCRRRRHGAGDDDDRISSLPDDLMRRILLRLGSTRAAARTSVLSRRWQRIWAHLPDLRLGTCDDHPGAKRLAPSTTPSTPASRRPSAASTSPCTATASASGRAAWRRGCAWPRSAA